MKSKERHDLKKNELADWLIHFPQWARENKGTIIYVSVIIIAVLGYYIWYTYTTNVIEKGEREQLTSIMNAIPVTKGQVIQARSQGKDESYILLNPADQLKTFAENTEDNNLAAMAWIKRGEILRSELLLRMEMVNQESIFEQMERAKIAYQNAIDRNPSNKTLLANAKMGLGIVEEELNNFQQAKKIYSELVKDEKYAGTIGSASAERRLVYMDELKERPEFESNPEKAKQIQELQQQMIPEANQPELPLPAPGPEDINS